MGRALTIVAFIGLLLLTQLASAQPPQGEIVLNNDSVRVTLLIFRPGGGTGQHVGLEPELGIVLEGELVLHTPNGQQLLKAGSAYWLPGLTPHDIRNESPGLAKLWDVLLKRCD